MDEYSLDEGILTLIDEAVGLDYREPFSPALLPDHPTLGQEVGDGETVHLALFGDGSVELAIECAGLWNGEYLLKDVEGNVKQRAYYREGVLHGPSRFYHPSGALVSEGWYIDGKQNGRALWFYPTGKPYSVQSYLEGLWHGPQLFFYPDGREKTSMTYIHGKITGEVMLYYPGGTLKRQLSF